MSAEKSPKTGMRANSHRGEVALDWGGVSYALIPSYRNLSAVEDELGCGFLELAEKLEARSIKVVDIAGIIATVADPRLEVAEAGEIVHGIGLSAAYAKVGEFLVAALFPAGVDEAEAGR